MDAGRNGIMMADGQRNVIQSMIISPVPDSSLKEVLCMKTNWLDGDIVQGDFWLLRPLIFAQIYFVLQC